MGTQELTKAIFQDDSHLEAEEAGTEVKSLLASDLPLVKEAWIRIRGGTNMCLTPPS